ncbi:MAG: TrkH family potassium uptake protein [Rikenellaceae bacterium]
MRLNIVFRYIGLVLLLNAIFMLISACFSAFAPGGMDSGFYPLILSTALTSVLGAFPLVFVRRKEQINTKESYMIVVGAWLLSCFVGTFPYLLWGGEFGFVNSWFESVSGFTTTGATILNDVEQLPRGLLFWRSSTHWLGGVGVVMFALIIVPAMGRNKMSLSSVELSSLAKDNYKYRAHKIVNILLFVYVGMTLCETVLLKIAGMSWFDAINHSFSTIATGGFSTKNSSILFYDNVWIEVILCVFMALAGLHFGLIFTTLAGKTNNIFRSEVSRFYFITMLVAMGIISLSLFKDGLFSDFLTSLRYTVFQVISIITTTGFATCDANLWTPLAIIVAIYLMFQCSCAGSTCGGIKADRILLASKVIKAKIKSQQHPTAVIRIKMNGSLQDKEVTSYAMIFIATYVMLTLAGTIVCTAFDMDLLTSFTMSLSCLGNIGPGFGDIGTLDNYGSLPLTIRASSTILMLLGRLEIFGLIQLFVIKWWK